MQTHYLNPRLLTPRRLPRLQVFLGVLGRLGDFLRPGSSRQQWAAGTSALLSFNPRTRTAIVFVHGFGGAAMTTWLNFPGLLNGNPATSACDLIFFEYDGLQTAAAESGNALMTFLDKLFTNAAPLVNPGLQYQPITERRPQDWAYESVLIVAHSLGAVVTRSALIEAQVKKLTWLPKTYFMLFAPADSGCVIEELVSQALLGIPYVKGLPAAAKLAFGLKPLEDVKSDSPTLKSLKEITAGELNANTSSFLLARKVLRAKQDSVVTNPVPFFPQELAKLDYVPREEPLPGSDIPTGHVAVCKPSETFKEPLDRVLSIFSSGP
jgi:hypothetical protein